MTVSNFKNSASMSLLIALLPLLFLWTVAFYSGIETAIAVWNVSEIFAHCFLVLPCSLYFIYLKRHELLAITFKPNYLLLPLFIGALLVQVFAEIGDIKVLQHMATFTALPILLWLFMGNEAAKIIAFPLFFMVFSIPIGEQLIPHLQDVTTNIAVPLIELSGVPIFRNGYYLDIPQGRFLVAEACSGISFLIASIVFGCLYSYISFTRFSKQLTFVGISIALPIIANAIRVFGIVLTAYLTDMEYAAGADHLIYGGVFYSFIIFMLIIIGEKFRDKDMKLTPFSSSTNAPKINSTVNYRKALISVGVIASMLIAGQQVWKLSMTAGKSTDVVFNLHDIGTNKNTISSDWTPHFNEAALNEHGVIQSEDNLSIDYFISAHTPQSGALISGQNYIFDNEKWSLLTKETIVLNDLGQSASLLKLVSAQGGYRYVITWYQLDDEILLSDIKMKLFKAVKLMKGNQPVSSVFAFSLKGADKKTKEDLINFVTGNHSSLHKVVVTGTELEK